MRKTINQFKSKSIQINFKSVKGPAYLPKTSSNTLLSKLACPVPQTILIADKKLIQSHCSLVGNVLAY